jgi:hypothetical protein
MSVCAPLPLCLHISNSKFKLVKLERAYINRQANRPISLYWTVSPTPQQTCINQTHHLLAAGCINTLTDFLTTLLPLPIAYNLKLPFRQAAIIFLLFAAGLLVTAAGGVRTYYTWRATSSK